MGQGGRRRDFEIYGAEGGGGCGGIAEDEYGESEKECFEGMGEGGGSEYGQLTQSEGGRRIVVEESWGW